MKKKSAAKPKPYPLADHKENASRVEQGVPVTDLVAFGRETGFTVDELAQLVHIPPRTYARRVASKARLSLPETAVAVLRMAGTDRPWASSMCETPTTPLGSSSCASRGLQAS
jgi:hypothetical protein